MNRYRQFRSVPIRKNAAAKLAAHRRTNGHGSLSSVGAGSTKFLFDSRARESAGGSDVVAGGLATGPAAFVVPVDTGEGDEGGVANHCAGTSSTDQYGAVGWGSGG